MSDERTGCDSCDRVVLLRYSPPHDAYFCPACFDRETAPTPFGEGYRAPRCTCGHTVGEHKSSRAGGHDALDQYDIPRFADGLEYTLTERIDLLARRALGAECRLRRLSEVLTDLLDRQHDYPTDLSRDPAWVAAFACGWAVLGNPDQAA